MSASWTRPPDFLKARVEAVPDITMPELAVELAEAQGIRATPAMLSRYLIHRLGCTYKKIADRDRAAAPEGSPRAIRVAPPPPAKDAS